MKLEKINNVVITVKHLNKTMNFLTNKLGVELQRFFHI